MSFALSSILFFAGVSAAAVLAGAVITWLFARVVLRRRFSRYWRKFLRAHLVLVPVYLLLVPPVAFAVFIRMGLGTRHDEVGYEGPRVDAAGVWHFQSRTSLDGERAGRAAGTNGGGSIAPTPRYPERGVVLEADDGVRLNAYFVPAAGEARFAAVAVHGLFRGGLELETVAAMINRLGGDVLMLEMRNHGRSGHACPSFGLRESRDVVAAARYLTERRPELPLILYGVSLGSAAVALAAPRVMEADGVVLDAPFPTFMDVFDHLAGERLGFFEPYRSLLLWSVELLCAFDAGDVRPVDAAASLDPSLPVLVIGAGEDDRAPPEDVRRVYAALRAPEGTKELWIETTAEHGKVWEVAPDRYEARLSGLIDRALTR